MHEPRPPKHVIRAPSSPELVSSTYRTRVASYKCDWYNGGVFWYYRPNLLTQITSDNLARVPPVDQNNAGKGGTTQRKVGERERRRPEEQLLVLLHGHLVLVAEAVLRTAIQVRMGLHLDVDVRRRRLRHAHLVPVQFYDAPQRNGISGTHPERAGEMRCVSTAGGA